MDTIGTRIKREREALGISRVELSRRTGVGYSTLAELERGGMQSTTKARVIAEALGVSLKWLETGRGDRTPSPLPESGRPSQPARIDPETLVAAIRLVRERFLVRDVELTIDHLESDGTILASAYEYQAKRKSEGQPAGNVVDFSKYLQGEKGARQLETNGGRHRAVDHA